MKKIILATAFVVASGSAFAQMAEVNEEIAAGLQTVIINNGFECAEVINVEPVGNAGAKITCIRVEGNEEIGVYLFSITADGLSVTEE